MGNCGLCQSNRSKEGIAYGEYDRSKEDQIALDEAMSRRLMFVNHRILDEALSRGSIYGEIEDKTLSSKEKCGIKQDL